MNKIDLIDTTEIKVRFNEVDFMGVVWHGNYVKYLEDGRESFGEKYGIHYLDFLNADIIVPLVNIEIDFKSPLKYREKAIVQTKYVDCEAAKLIFEYVISGSSNNEIIATAKSVQVFLNRNMELLLTFPNFFLNWKQKMLRL
ncbi:MAG: acyl-CoA thioesterase [Bacteroidales bacterium]|jgi:acyl-CoA thioester hydrolase